MEMTKEEASRDDIAALHDAVTTARGCTRTRLPQPAKFEEEHARQTVKSAA
jgi:hypothetical protein